jgi:hypothetical protein
LASAEGLKRVQRDAEPTPDLRAFVVEKRPAPRPLRPYLTFLLPILSFVVLCDVWFPVSVGPGEVKLVSLRERWAQAGWAIAR